MLSDVVQTETAPAISQLSSFVETVQRKPGLTLPMDAANVTWLKLNPFDTMQQTTVFNVNIDLFVAYHSMRSNPQMHQIWVIHSKKKKKNKNISTTLVLFLFLAVDFPVCSCLF